MIVYQHEGQLYWRDGEPIPDGVKLLPETEIEVVDSLFELELLTGNDELFSKALRAPDHQHRLNGRDRYLARKR